MLQTLSRERAGVADPLPAATETGLLGVYQLKRAWARRLAQEFGRLQSTLAEARLRLSDVAEKVGTEIPELERWTRIAALEELQAQRLAHLNLRDPQAAKIGRASSPVLPEGIKRIVVIGTPDPLPIAVTILAGPLNYVGVDPKISCHVPQPSK